jgi:two-component system sensor histidine kinase/response regulator
MTGPQARILCADDVEDNRILVEETLADEGLAVVSCASGDALIEAFRQGGADLLLLDVRMPGRDGFETLAAVRELAGGAHVPALFLTAQRDLDTFDRALAAKAEFISKPIRPAELAGRVGTLLRLGALDAELRAHHDELARQRDAIMRLQLQHEMMSAFLVHDLKSPAGAIALHADVLRRDRRLPNDARESAEAIGGAGPTHGAPGAQHPRPLPRGRGAAPDLARGSELVRARDGGERGLCAARARAERDHPARDRARRVCARRRRHAPTRAREPRRERAAPCAHGLRGSRRGAPASARWSSSACATQAAASPAALHERIFERFAQLGSRDESRRGHGLGLPFCRVAADLHGGTITIDPERAGAVFVLRLPARGDA